MRLDGAWGGHGLFAAVEKRLVPAIFRWQRQAARRLGWGGELFGGAVVFAQYFGSSLQLTPHLHGARSLSAFAHSPGRPSRLADRSGGRPLHRQLAGPSNRSGSPSSSISAQAAV
jgi:hypothetical protein